MIIGNGDIAKALKPIPLCNKKGYVFFASGVSNSQEKRESEYQREKKLLLLQPKNKHLVYISSLCIFYSDNRYARHKKEMEEVVKKEFKHYTIIRLGNITWGNNPHTLINYFRNCKKQGKKFEVRDAYRYLIGKKEFQHWVNLIPPFNCEMNITGKKLKVSQIVKLYVR